MRSDHRHLTAYQIGCEVGQAHLDRRRLANCSRKAWPERLAGPC
jgi:hypothetical protein